MKTSYILVVTFRGSLAFGPFEKEVSKILGRNESGSGFSFLDGKRELVGYFKQKRTLQKKMNAIKEFAKSKKAKVEFFIYED